jgi:anaerobic selenocysteine-containing dehydrogenase
MPFTRRDILFGLGGSAAGLALSPLPWKLLDDVSIWTQRRHALPLPPRGSVSFRATHCTLCPGGCALRVRCVAERPLAAMPAAGQPGGAGACALGLTLPHLPLHPLRLAGPQRRNGGRPEPVTLETAVEQIAAATRGAEKDGRSVMVLDRRPGRVVSTAWLELLSALPNGVYATLPGEDATFAALGGALEQPAPLGVDLEQTGTLVSFGAPVLEGGWGRPGRVLAARSRLRVVQVDAWRSPSAALADEWLSVAPGAHGLVAIALAHAVARERGLGDPLRQALAPFAPERVASAAGVDASRMDALARSLVARGPAVAIGGGDPGAGPLGNDVEQAIALLDLALGSVGVPGGFVARRPVPEAPSMAQGATLAALHEVPTASVAVALVDAADDGRALPWPALERVLAPGALVVSLSPFDGVLARRAALVVPAPAPLEAPEEVLPSADAAVASWAMAPALVPAPQAAIDGVALAARLASALGASVPQATLEERLKQRAAAIHGAGRGRFLARGERDWTETAVDSADAAYELVAQGGTWVDDPAPTPKAGARVPQLSKDAVARWTAPSADGLALVPFAVRGTAGSTPVSPLLTKLYQESDLRPPTAVVAVSPATARALRIGDHRRVRVTSGAGSVIAELRHDPSLPDGRLALAAGPDPAALQPGAMPGTTGALPLAVTEEDGTWRATRVRVEEA